MPGVHIDDHDFGNWLAGYTLYYNYGLAGEIGTRGAGHAYELGRTRFRSYDDLGSKYFISGGIMMADERRWTETNRSMGNLDFVMTKSDLFYGVDRIASTDIYSTDFDQELNLYTTFWNSGSPRH
jgi:hypothetical protein